MTQAVTEEEQEEEKEEGKADEIRGWTMTFCQQIQYTASLLDMTWERTSIRLHFLRVVTQEREMRLAPPRWRLEVETETGRSETSDAAPREDLPFVRYGGMRLLAAHPCSDLGDVDFQCRAATKLMMLQTRSGRSRWNFLDMSPCLYLARLKSSNVRPGKAVRGNCRDTMSHRVPFA